MFALTLLFLIFTNAQYISNSSGLYIFNAKLSQIKSLLLPETIINVIGNFDVDGGFVTFSINKIIMKSFNNSIPIMSYTKRTSLLKIINFEYYEGIFNLYYYFAKNEINSLVLHTTLDEFKNNINYFGNIIEDNFFRRINIINIELLYESSEQEDINNYNHNHIKINKETNLSEIVNNNKINCDESQITITLNDTLIIDTNHKCNNVIDFNIVFNTDKDLVIKHQLTNINNIILNDGNLKIYVDNININNIYSYEYTYKQLLQHVYLNDYFNININRIESRIFAFQKCILQLGNLTINNNDFLPICYDRYNGINYFSENCNEGSITCP